MKERKSRFYLALIIFSLVGQVAWVVENMYFNVFIYKMFNASAGDISAMVMASAVAAALTTILMGALSDRVGKRKLFICGGYVLWGISIGSFALLRMEVLTKVAGIAGAASLGITLTILMDCVMTFFGSTANDACFNAWLTDATDETNRGAAEGLNSMMPLLAILVVFGGFMAFDLNRSDSWAVIFLTIGIAVTLIGAAGFFLIREPRVEKVTEGYWTVISYGLQPKVAKRHPIFYGLLLALAAFGISIQIFMPYLILYYEQGLKMENYVLIFAPAIVIAAVFTALYGRRYDQSGFSKSVVLPMALLCLGYVILYLCRSTALVFVGSLLMMCGYLASNAIFGAALRDYTPKGMAGRFQGLRIVGAVLVPGVIGPALGAYCLRDADTVVGSDGTESFVPNANIFLWALAATVLIWGAIAWVSSMMKREHRDLTTPEGEHLPADAWQSHPRPQCKRESYVNLNGEWSFSLGTRYHGVIRVPYPVESRLSGVALSPKKGEEMTYTRTFFNPGGPGKRVLLHLDAVDQIAKVYINGSLVTEHQGGYLPIDCDITDFLGPGENELKVVVRDDLDPKYPYGKQTHKRGGMWYTPFSGIWQTVWMEVVPENYIRKLKITPGLTAVTVEVLGGTMEKTIEMDGRTIAFVGGSITVTLENPRLWTPEEPNLYPFTITAGEDRIQSYCALRTLESKVVDGIPRLCLNGKPYFFHGLLDQGYFPEGISTPASEEGYARDIRTMKELGYNTLRKHIKVEPAVFYYECDRQGMIVWQDFVNNAHYSFLRDTALPTVLPNARVKDEGLNRDPETRRVFLENAGGTVEHLYNYPCICLWTIFNEGWGQFRADEAFARLRQWDPTRLIDATSGWFWHSDSDVDSYHVYFRPLTEKKGSRPWIVSEFGGYALVLPQHCYSVNASYGYANYKNPGELQKAVTDLYLNQVAPLIPKGLCAAIYTQVSDVEDETNGLMTYDRKVCKVDKTAMRKIADSLKI